VDNFWTYLFIPDGKGIPLINFLEKEGIRGCFSYWKGTLNEEAADFTMYLNEKRGFFYNVMHHCPSKGRLLQFKEERGITPYRDYCLHCDHYRASAEKAGLKYIYNFNGVDHAACSMLIYDPKVFDGRVIIDEDTEIIDRRASDNEYFHRDFHSSLNNGVQYLGEKYGEKAIDAYLTCYTKNVCKQALADVKERGLDAVADYIRGVYAQEKAEDAVTLSQTEKSLTVTVHYCPAVRHLRETGRDVSPWFAKTTEVVMAVLADAGGLTFTMDTYDDKTGAAAYAFTA